MSKPRKVTPIASVDMAALCRCSHLAGVHDPHDSMACYHQDGNAFDCDWAGFVAPRRSPNQCRRLHSLSGKNLYLYVRKSDGYVIRGCRACRRLAAAQWHGKHPHYNRAWLARHPTYWTDRLERERRVAA